MSGHSNNQEMEDTRSEKGDGSTLGVAVSGPTAQRSLLNRDGTGKGVRDIRDANTENFLGNYLTTTMTVTSHALHRTLSIDNDVFTQSHNDSPWKEQGNIVFICEGGIQVRAHGTLLNAILPRFVADLVEIQKFVNDPTSSSAPNIPVFVKGIEARCVELFLTLCNKSVAFMTGREIIQMKRMIDVLNIEELSVFVAPAVGGFSGNPLGVDGTGALALGTSVVATAATSANGGGDDRSKNVLVPERRKSRPPSVEKKQRIKSKSSLDKNSSGENGTGGNEDRKTKKKKAIFTVEFREQVLSALKSGATVGSVAKQFNVKSTTISRWKYLAKKTSSSDVNVAVQVPKQTTSGGLNIVERAAAPAVNSPVVKVYSSVQGKLGTASVPKPVGSTALGIDSIFMRNRPIGIDFIASPNVIYPESVHHSESDLIAFINMAISNAQKESGAREDDLGIEAVRTDLVE